MDLMNSTNSGCSTQERRALSRAGDLACAPASMYDKIAIVRIFGRNRRPRPDWVAWFSNYQAMRTLHGPAIPYTFAYKIGREGQVKTVTNERVGPEDLQPGEEALCVNTVFSLQVAYTSRVDLVEFNRGTIRFELHHGGDRAKTISSRIDLTLNFVRGDEIDLTVARLLFGFMEGARSISRVDLERRIGGELSGNVRHEIQSFLNHVRGGGEVLETQANTELRKNLRENYFTQKNQNNIPKCLELQDVAAQTWT